MHTYVLYREHASYEEVKFLVVVAPDEDTARAMAVEAHGQENPIVWDIAVCVQIDLTQAHIVYRGVHRICG